MKTETWFACILSVRKKGSRRGNRILWESKFQYTSSHWFAYVMEVGGSDPSVDFNFNLSDCDGLDRALLPPTGHQWFLPNSISARDCLSYRPEGILVEDNRKEPAGISNSPHPLQENATWVLPSNLPPPSGYSFEYSTRKDSLFCSQRKSSQEAKTVAERCRQTREEHFTFFRKLRRRLTISTYRASLTRQYARRRTGSAE